MSAASFGRLVADIEAVPGRLAETPDLSTPDFDRVIAAVDHVVARLRTMRMCVEPVPPSPKPVPPGRPRPRPEFRVIQGDAA